MNKFGQPFYLTFALLNGIALIVAFYLSINIIPIFFSYFTVLSNILMTSFFIFLGITKFQKLTTPLAWLHGAAVLYMSMTGVIYWTVLVNQHSLSIDPWINLTLHGIMPIASFLSWLLFPLKNKIKYAYAIQWLSLPLIFALFTLMRGSYTNWYPYFFLNPNIESGYLKVTLNILMILLSSYTGGLILIWLNKIAAKKFKT